MSATSCSRDTLSPTSLPLVLTHSLRHLPCSFHSQTCLMTCWTLQKLHRSQFMGEMDLLVLICLLWLLLRLQALQFTSRPLPPHIIHSLLLLLLLLLHLLPLLHPQLLPLVPNASGVQGTSGCQSNGLSQTVTRSLESLHQLWSPQMKQTAILTTLLTSSKLVWPLHLNLHHTGSPSNAQMQNCGRKLVRKRWRHTDSMALGKLSNCPLGSVQLAPDGS